ncbi:hypothetical protein SmJEL517_g03366 [Synchytrium microbalum]|uniref:C2HC/C3H-type domain-containing protein n=1 Tax=Synchytrium microbalum TaxID=1806994 RepID=A0A507BX67_9FUNG|nr:uncharacterized protein SmJEL517_g03366 [Synchytrium microbalum]TPX33920.1 hypothetical protein SmJEL517_g03366 [Synchytrium microbalum]
MVGLIYQLIITNINTSRCAKNIGRGVHREEEQYQQRPYSHAEYASAAEESVTHSPIQQPASPIHEAQHEVNNYEPNAYEVNQVRAIQARPADSEYDEFAERVACELCNRKFASNRLEKHMEACRKMSNSHRKVFDSSVVRTEGTEAAKFYKATLEKQNSDKATKTFEDTRIKRAPVRHSTKDMGAVKAIKAAAKQAGGARGSFAVAVEIELNECPTCGRKFSPDSLERHANFCRESALKKQANRNNVNPAGKAALDRRLNFKATSMAK